MPAPVAVLLPLLGALGIPIGGGRAGTLRDRWVDLRMPDAVGNLFRASDKSDRKYGPAGQLLESTGPDGTTRHKYDPERNLVKKLVPDGGEWRYEWNGAGMLAKVIRPEGWFQRSSEERRREASTWEAPTRCASTNLGIQDL